jgi:hypothetical protein
VLDTSNQTIYYHGIANTMAVLNYVIAQQTDGEYLAGKLKDIILSTPYKAVVVYIS